MPDGKQCWCLQVDLIPAYEQYDLRIAVDRRRSVARYGASKRTLFTLEYWKLSEAVFQQPVFCSHTSILSDTAGQICRFSADKGILAATSRARARRLVGRG